MPRWFQGGAASDEEIKAKFQADVETLASGACDTWLGQHPWNSLAGIILMDQFTRQIYRGTPQIYALPWDKLVLPCVPPAYHAIGLSPQCLVVVMRGCARGFDRSACGLEATSQVGSCMHLHLSITGSRMAS